MNTKKVIGVHIGGKGVNCAAIDLETKSIIPGSESEGRVDKDATDRHILSLWSMQIKKSLKAINEEELIGIGFSIPGPFDYTNGIAKFIGVPKYEQLNGSNITEELSKRLMLKNPTEIRYINDANGFAIGQEWINSSSANKGIAIIIDEGFGSAFLSNQLPTLSGNVPKNGVVFNLPFKNGIADDYFSVRGLMNEFSNHGKLILNNAHSLILNARKSQQGKEIFDEFGERIGVFLIPIIKDFNPGYLTFGGLIGSELDLFESGLQRILEAEGLNIALQRSEEGNRCFLYGGARLFDEGYWRKIKPLLSQMV